MASIIVLSKWGKVRGRWIMCLRLTPVIICTPSSGKTHQIPVMMMMLIYWAEAYVKGKAIPLQAWKGLAGSRRLRLPDFKTIGT
jgi:hypothetical protein